MFSEGADLDAVNRSGFNALHYASVSGNASIIAMLLDKGMDMDKRTKDGRNALMIALQFGKTAAVEFLVSCAEGSYKDS